MKPNQAKPDEVFRLFDRQTGALCGSYSRACCDEFDFTSAAQARSANVHDIFQDKAKYRVARYRVTYELLDEEAD